ncbi:MAG TPA: ribonuclease P protein component, partial [Allocoleopsis sp.]
MALPKAYRLKQRQEFSAVFQLGIKRTTPHLTLRALSPTRRQRQKPEPEQPQEQMPPTRIG